MLRISILGHLGADPELRSTQKGAPLVSFRVAVNQLRTDATTGERAESTEWFRVRVLGRQTEFARRLGKGTRVYVAGRLEIGHYQSSDGQARVGFDVWADDVQALSARAAEEADSAAPRPSSGPGQRRAVPGRGSATTPRPQPPEGDLEDLPW